MAERMAAGADPISLERSLGFKKLKPLIPIWVKDAYEAVPTETITHGWVKIGIMACWTAAFQKEAEQQREFLVANPVAKKNAKKVWPVHGMFNKS